MLEIEIGSGKFVGLVKIRGCFLDHVIIHKFT